MRLLLLALLLPLSVSAQTRLDRLKAMPDMSYCQVVADQVWSGIVSQQAGFAKQFREATPEILALAEHGKLPKDAMYVPEWDSLDPVDQEFVRQNVFIGYEASERIGRKLEEEEISRMGQAFFERCMYDRTKEKRTSIDSFIKVDALSNAANAKERRFWQCAQHLDDEAAVGKAIKKGAPCDKMLAILSKTPDADPHRAKVLREACENQDRIQEWFDEKYNACMGEYK